jgi:NTP pyrophosphatase (non-canonical NTP hydrolase)
MWDEIASLLDYLGRDVPPEIRILKLAEETGEAAQALHRDERVESPERRVGDAG